ncbi:MAG: 4a-hydroxytetrahydrobiopterin dehydratase [Gammaproteobacteria bacterium]|nr:4a-hydroxytetrahydrobiopterin dehydratase [Gammaproteobacteria bacterium]
MALASESCVACRPDSPALGVDERRVLLEHVPGWALGTRGDMPVLTRTFLFGDFAGALEYTNAVGGLAEAADHHPEIVTEWGRVRVTWWTHAIGGLHRNDFILAARCNEIAPG